MKHIFAALLLIVSSSIFAADANKADIVVVGNVHSVTAQEIIPNSDANKSESINEYLPHKDQKFTSNFILASSDIGQCMGSCSSQQGMCMGSCSSQQGMCMGQCQGNGQCISACANAHGGCVAGCSNAHGMCVSRCSMNQ
ncbi:MAG: hypothetical protein PHI11_01680 [Gallionella sp.]|nr:hypothetical protein [Gallionella sp.]